MEIFGMKVRVVNDAEGFNLCPLCAFDKVCNNIRGTLFPCRKADGRGNRYFKEVADNTPRLSDAEMEIMYNPSKEI
jgi:hypothetical protein